MSWTAPKTWVLGAVLPSADLNEQVRDNLIFLKNNIALEAPAELTIDTGAVTKTQSHHLITAESGAEDDLETINGGADGEVLLFRAKTGHTITFKHGIGNIICVSGEDIELTGSMYVLAVCDGTNWVTIGSGDGGGLTEEEVLALISDDENLSAAAQAAITASHSNANDPTADEKAALVGTDGTPSAENPYVTDSDERLGAGGGIDKGIVFPETAEHGDALYRTDLDRLYLCKEAY